ncbi:MAG: methyltransferase family protein [Candidatus Odinarchaeota archaeon]
MELLPKIKFGLINGWIYFIFYLVIFIIVMITCSKDVRKRLYDRSLWDKKTKIITAIGKLFSLANIIMIIFGAIQFKTVEFIIGTILYSIGLIGLIVAIINYRNAPLDKPITRRLYKISRNPQIIMIYILFTGMILVINSWINLIFLFTLIICTHFSILGEEKALTEQYGELYLDYKKRVPRYFLFF